MEFIDPLKNGIELLLIGLALAALYIFDRPVVRRRPHRDQPPNT